MTHKSILDLTENEFGSFVVASIRECGQCIIDNAGGSDDSHDYIDSATDIIRLLMTDEVNMQNVLNLMFNALPGSGNNPYDTYASDAIPSIWNEYIVHTDSDAHIRDYPITD